MNTTTDFFEEIFKKNENKIESRKFLESYVLNNDFPNYIIDKYDTLKFNVMVGFDDTNLLLFVSFCEFILREMNIAIDISTSDTYESGDYKKTCEKYEDESNSYNIGRLLRELKNKTSISQKHYAFFSNLTRRGENIRNEESHHLMLQKLSKYFSIVGEPLNDRKYLSDEKNKEVLIFLSENIPVLKYHSIKEMNEKLIVNLFEILHDFLNVHSSSLLVLKNLR